MKLPLIAFLLLTTHSLNACLDASQYRLFPLGKTSEGFCVVETRLYRMEYTEYKGDESWEPGWAGKSYFKIYDKDYKEICSELIDNIELFDQIHYNSVIEQIFKKGLGLASKYTSFIVAKPMSLVFCDYQQTCSSARLLFDTIQNKISIQLPNKNEYPVAFFSDSLSIASRLVQYYSFFDDDKIFSAKTLRNILYINSVRQFEIGNKKLTIVHIGSGNTVESVDGFIYPPGSEYEANINFSDINKSIFEEPVLHHGNGFDFYIWE